MSASRERLREKVLADQAAIHQIRLVLAAEPTWLFTDSTEAELMEAAAEGSARLEAVAQLAGLALAQGNQARLEGLVMEALAQRLANPDGAL